MTSQTGKGEKFARSHVEPGIVVLPNAWDPGSAIMMVEAGFPAIATTSAGVAFAMGLPDGQRVSRERMIECVAHSIWHVTASAPESRPRVAQARHLS